MRMKMFVAACASGLLAASAFAQSTTDPKTGVGPAGPTKAQCDAGHGTSKSKMAKKDFDTACAKMRERTQKTQ